MAFILHFLFRKKTKTNAGLYILQPNCDFHMELLAEDVEKASYQKQLIERKATS